MKRSNSLRRLLALALTLALALGLALPAGAVSEEPAVRFEQVDNDQVSAELERKTAESTEDTPQYSSTDVVRVSIVLEGKSTVEAGYSTSNIAKNEAAMAYRASLKERQAKMEQAISSQVLGGEALDVEWNLTLVANIISANVPYGKLEEIKAMEGVEDVVLEPQYEPAVASKGGDDPQMSTSDEMIGSTAAWLNGYTGAGSRLAVIDTGTDTDHQSFAAAAYEYSLRQNAEAKGMSYEDYAASLNLLNVAEITSVLEELHSYERSASAPASQYYVSSKLPFAYNYVDHDFDVTHDNDGEGEHGSHVAGIAAANKYVADGDSFASALEKVYVQGVAPDAQLITMKVFGKGGGAYASDYMVAIEDAIILGCDSVNLSLGSGNAGMTTNSTYQGILDMLAETDTVVVMSAGNSGSWVENAASGIPYLYLDDVNMDTAGSPGSYANSLSVASVDNIGTTGQYFKIGEQMVFYNEVIEGTSGKYTNTPLAGLDTGGEGTEYEYIFFENVGVDGSNNNLLTPYADAVKDKVVFVYRGTSSFYQKHMAVEEVGGLACIVNNNQAGTINMDLSDSTATIPCVSILQSEAAQIKAASTPVYAGDGETVLYYTGKMTIASKIGTGVQAVDYYTMSDFSSWGVPSDLSMKPEITAPGGSIYSVNGAVAGGQSYEVMSGTSMAAPQITGMVAVVAQYIEENGLAEKTGMSVRHLAQSLLMSTAEPVLEAESDYYYSILKQGAGLANVGAAVSAESYVLVDGQDDGKVKVELGDDPDRNGVYSATFTLNNLTDQAVEYQLSADVFTQAPVSDGVNLYMYTATTPLAANVSWTADGKAVATPELLAQYDFDGDGDTDADDAQALLDYVTGAREEINAETAADVDGDGDVDTHDVYTLLNLISSATVTVPASGKLTITVTMALTAEEKEFLDAYYTSGAYVEAFLTAAPASTAEGAAGVTHTIPVLGFYGNWSDGSMYDVGTLADYWYGTEERDPYLPDSDGYPNYFGNYMTIKYAGDSSEYFYFGNPLMDDDEYLPERNALNNENGDQLFKQYFAQIRNAGNSKLLITDAETGEVYFDAELGASSAAYYYSNGQTWRDTQSSLTMGWDGVDSRGNKLPEGTTVNISLVMAPEYYAKADGSYDWNALGEGAYMTTMTTIDNTAPVIEDVAISLMDGAMNVTACDNEYIAVVALYDAKGENALSYDTPNQTEPGESQTVRLDLSKAVGKTFLVQVYDYAMNVSTYKVTYDMTPDIDGYYSFFDMGAKTWYTYTEDGTAHAATGKTNLKIYAADYANGYVFAVDESNDLYVMPEGDFANVTFIGSLKDDTVLAEADGFFVSDMAYSAKDGKMYFSAYSTANEMECPYFCTVDLLTAEVQVLGEMGEDIWTLAVDGNGTFYGQGTFDNVLYTFTAESFTEPEAKGELADELSIYMAQSSLTWDGGNQKLAFTLATSSATSGQVLSADIFLIDPVTLEFTKLAEHENKYAMVGAYVAAGQKIDAGAFAPTTQVNAVVISDDALALIAGETVTLSAYVTPWTVTDAGIVWSSSNDQVAKVSASGLVTAVSAGECDITATSALDPTKSASCHVTVEAVTLTLTGVLQDAEGNPQFFQWDLEKDKTWTAGNAIEAYIASATYDAAKESVYVNDSSSMLMYQIDPATGKTLARSGAATAFGAPMQDMAALEYYAANNEQLLLGVYGAYLLGPNTAEANSFTSGWNLASYLSQYTQASKFVAVTNYGASQGDSGVEEMLLGLTDSGYLWALIYRGTTSIGLNFFETTLPALDYPTYNGIQNCSLTVADDGSLVLSYFTGESNEIYLLVPMSDGEDIVFKATRVGDFGADVWPASILSATVNGVEGAATKEQVLEYASAAEPMTATAEALEAADYVAPTKVAMKASGSLNTATAYRAPAAQLPAVPMGGTMTAEGDVTVNITADEDTTNGMMEITWDPALMTYASANCAAQLSSVNASEGKLTLGYASQAVIAKDAVLATLTFKAVGEATCDLSVQVKTVERNEQSGLEETVTLTIDRDAAAHVWSEWQVTKEADCFHDGEETRTCSHCDAVETRKIPANSDHCPSEAFTDVNTDLWYHEGVDFVVKNGYMKGMSDTVFGVDGELTRAQLATILYRVAGSPSTEGMENPFTDVAEGIWYEDAIKWAANCGVVNGVTETTFAPEDSVTREQIATMLYRYENQKKTSGAGLDSFPDGGQVSDWAVEAMGWAVTNGFINGITESDGKIYLQPQATATRAQIATILMRYLEAD